MGKMRMNGFEAGIKLVLWRQVIDLFFERLNVLYGKLFKTQIYNLGSYFPDQVFDKIFNKFDIRLIKSRF